MRNFDLRRWRIWGDRGREAARPRRPLRGPESLEGRALPSVSPLLPPPVCEASGAAPAGISAFAEPGTVAFQEPGTSAFAETGTVAFSEPGTVAFAEPGPGGLGQGVFLCGLIPPFDMPGSPPADTGLAGAPIVIPCFTGMPGAPTPGEPVFPVCPDDFPLPAILLPTRRDGPTAPAPGGEADDGPALASYLDQLAAAAAPAPATGGEAKPVPISLEQGPAPGAPAPDRDGAQDAEPAAGAAAAPEGLPLVEDGELTELPDGSF